MLTFQQKIAKYSLKITPLSSNARRVNNLRSGYYVATPAAHSFIYVCVVLIVLIQRHIYSFIMSLETTNRSVSILSGHKPTPEAR